MSLSLKKGDKVICIDDRPHGGYVGVSAMLTLNTLYTITGTYNIYGGLIVVLEGIKLEWNSSRFRKADESPPTLKSSTSPIVDDYVCKRCNNPKLSQTEKSCWSCGEAIKP